MKDLLLKLWVKAQILKEDRGQDLIEYGLLAALLALAAVTAMGTLATSINGVFTNIAGQLDDALPA